MIKNSQNISTERNIIALEAAYEIEAISNLLIRSSKDKSNETLDIVTRSLGARLKQLNTLVISSIGDAVETTESIKRKAIKLDLIKDEMEG